jgi:hypothetical protein
MDLRSKFKVSIALFRTARSLSTTPRSRTSFQVLSDLRLEIGQQYSSFKFPVTAPCLILAEDIGRLIDYELFEAS